ncbi:hypothetical protein [Leucobacter sp. cx-169]|uniref:hypothetical protein n=1 Tax=Leucobacter sp. cx-169 TaxID=2770549 RepID=UPI00165DCCF1|nr:hypothetical protein [Leucobacter sp. cx-169]MBC9927264.1 hypothetical protein [Leucobacter sp. cx-169]
MSVVDGYFTTRITCEEREELIDSVGRDRNGPADQYGVGASLTDVSGTYGDPKIYTRWENRVTDVPLFDDTLWPNSDRPCEHRRYDPIPGYVADED